MDFITQNWSWLLTLLAFITVAMIGISMFVTQKLEDRHKKEFEQEFEGSLKPIPVEEE
ncbi:hypothetical protein [Desmospora profundinema]|uniref:Flp pilus assembly protein TadB n=1 Tax=Desmospora profundinema TaxID=1571184 RepID=A0ABU1IRW4_9BACL|nr:hypothetical protein [Desmospora profundinema]MDR6227532.1 Flp pilus assembly protein TadB [Desmospora profundinema]